VKKSKEALLASSSWSVKRRVDSAQDVMAGFDGSRYFGVIFCVPSAFSSRQNSG
jgi:hypothetical protein